MTNPIGALLAEKGVLLADGAMGTGLFAMGLEFGEAPELWNETCPDRVAALHRSFVDAGADIILTNSFGGNRHRLKLHRARHRVRELNGRAAGIARAIADGAGRRVIVAGSVGPTGERLRPPGTLAYEEAVDAFAGQIEGLKEGGAEVAWIETMWAPAEIRAAAEAAIRVGLPYVYTASFDAAGRTMAGLAPKDIHHVADGLAEAPAAVGANCGIGASDTLAALLDISGAKPDATIVVKSNCGIPELRGGEARYLDTPGIMADYARLAVDAGARIVGGCCGTSLAHLKAMREALDTHRRAQRPSVEEIVARLGPLRGKRAGESGGDVARQPVRNP